MNNLLIAFFSTQKFVSSQESVHARFRDCAKGVVGGFWEQILRKLLKYKGITIKSKKLRGILTKTGLDKKPSSKRDFMTGPLWEPAWVTRA